MSWMNSSDLGYGYCKVRGLSDIVADATWLLQDMRTLRHRCVRHVAAARYEKSPASLRLAHGCCKLRIFSALGLLMAVARPSDAMREVIGETVSD